jgi:DNA-binding MarR family transcriptional regulator/DNA-binding XRE family transcriptional regulator
MSIVKTRAAWAELLKVRRAELGWSQRDLAQRAGVHQPQVVKAERGDDLQLSVLERIAAPMGLAPTLAQESAVLSPFAAAAALGDGRGNEAARLDGDVVQHSLESWRRAWPQFDPEVFAVIARLLHLGHHVDHSIAVLAEGLGMNSGDVMVLGALRRMGAPFESTPTGLKRLLWISLPGLKKRVDRLAELGMVERIDNPLDRRGQLVRLTSRGHEALEELLSHPAPVFVAVQALGGADRRRLSHALRKLLQQLDHEQHVE